MNADGTDGRELMPDEPKKQWEPDISPDGTKIVYVSREASSKEKLYIANADGTGAKELMPDDPNK